MLECPRCSSSEVHRSRAKSLAERVRRRLTRKRLFRCHRCEWRGWGIPMDRPQQASVPRAPGEIEKLDADLREAIDKLDATLDTL